MMELEVRLYATLKEKVGQNRVKVEVNEGDTLETLVVNLGKSYPSLKKSLESAVVSVNRTFAEGSETLHAGDEIAIFPPVSGGKDPYPTYFALAEEELDINRIHQALTQDDVGAIISFTGKVRGETQRDGMPPATIQLEYEAYEEMAIAKMRQIASEIWDKWPQVKGVAIVQRVGLLEVGETTTFVACAAGHRDQGAFDACRYGIDRLKEIVPVWKKEIGPDRSEWVEGHYHPTINDN
ncbi:MAG: MoaD family protein [Chloroflexota bacterium]